MLKMAIAIVSGFAVCSLPLSIFFFIAFPTDIIIWTNCGIPYLFYVGHFKAQAILVSVLFSAAIIARNLRLSLNK